jgi:hypothetical protein
LMAAKKKRSQVIETWLLAPKAKVLPLNEERNHHFLHNIVLHKKLFWMM